VANKKPSENLKIKNKDKNQAKIIALNSANSKSSKFFSGKQKAI
jgi:hypothetical protein